MQNTSQSYAPKFAGRFWTFPPFSLGKSNNSVNLTVKRLEVGYKRMVLQSTSYPHY